MKLIEKLSNFYCIVATTIFTLALIFISVYGLVNFSLSCLGATSDYRVEQYPYNGSIRTYVWAKRFDDDKIIYSFQDEVTPENADSVSKVHRTQANKLIKSFKKLK